MNPEKVILSPKNQLTVWLLATSYGLEHSLATKPQKGERDLKPLSEQTVHGNWARHCEKLSLRFACAMAFPTWAFIATVKSIFPWKASWLADQSPVELYVSW
jgi:hypothetical protein